jgi:hypothetical protein
VQSRREGADDQDCAKVGTVHQEKDAVCLNHARCWSQLSCSNQKYSGLDEASQVCASASLTHSIDGWQEYFELKEELLANEQILLQTIGGSSRLSSPAVLLYCQSGSI